MMPVVASYLDAQQNFIKLRLQRAGEQREATNAEHMRTICLIAGVIAAIFLVFVASPRLLVRSISLPLNALARQAERIRSSDLSGVIEVDRGDEIGKVQPALSGMQAALQRVVGMARYSADSIQTASQEIATGNHLTSSTVQVAQRGGVVVGQVVSTMNEIVANVGRVSDIIAEISASRVQQSAGLSTINSAVGQLDQMTQQNAALVEQSAAAAESLRDQAARLAGLVSGFKLI